MIFKLVLVSTINSESPFFLKIKWMHEVPIYMCMQDWEERERRKEIMPKKLSCRLNVMQTLNAMKIPPTLELDSVLTVQTFPKCERKYPKMDEM